MRNLKDINKFVLVKPGDGLVLEGGEFPREVRLEVNCDQPCHLAVRVPDGDSRFLAVVEGRETVVFTIEEPCILWSSCDGELRWWTVELEAASIVSDAETYTKIAERRTRNPELERVARKMQENAERRMAALMREMDAKFASIKPEKPDEPAPVVDGKAGGKPGGKAAKQPPAVPEEDDGGGDEQPPV